jgi:methionyl-tRNA formyltransferase
VFLSDKGEEWNVKIYEAKLLMEEHSLATGSLICTKRDENCGRKRIHPNFKFAIRVKEMTTPELLNGISFSEVAKSINSPKMVLS